MSLVARLKLRQPAPPRIDVARLQQNEARNMMRQNAFLTGWQHDAPILPPPVRDNLPEESIAAPPPTVSDFLDFRLLDAPVMSAAQRERVRAAFRCPPAMKQAFISQCERNGTTPQKVFYCLAKQYIDGGLTFRHDGDTPLARQGGVQPVRLTFLFESIEQKEKFIRKCHAERLTMQEVLLAWLYQYLAAC